MFQKDKNMKRVLIVVVGGFCVILFVFAGISGYFTQKLNEKHKLLLKLDGISLKLQNHKDDFEAFTSYNAKFDSIQNNIPFLEKQSIRFYDHVSRKINEVNHVTGDLKELIQYAQLLIQKEKEIIGDASKIGFKEFGFMGEMRKIIHTVEDNYPQFRDKILSLRRHEKDFIMRLDVHYAELLHEELNKWKKNGNFPKELLSYETSFDSLMKRIFQLKEHAISSNNNSWLSTIEILKSSVRIYRRDLLIETYSISNKAQRVLWIVSGLSILACIFVSLFFIKNLTSQVKTLQSTMNQFVKSNYNMKYVTTEGLSKNEIGQIGTHFVRMALKIKREVNLLEERVKSRTLSLEQKNELLEKQQKEMNQSLEYARNLQESILVSKDQLKQHFKQLEIYYSPKNKVGGDFYWMHAWKTKQEDKILFCLADCTGHGVPGALLSVLGMNILDGIVKAGIKTPNLILEQLMNQLIEQLNAQNKTRMDGMDIALFCLDKKTNELQFSGLILPLWIVRGNEIIELKSNRTSIGSSYSNYSSIKTECIQLQPNDQILLFSDGLVDQFGGLNQKKYGKKRLRNFILSAMQKENTSLFEVINQEIKSWKGKEEQTDDMTFISIVPNIKVLSYTKKTIEKNNLNPTVEHENKETLILH